MRGFTGDLFNGQPVFIREEYEQVHCNMSEKERLEEVLGCSFSSLLSAITYAEIHNPNLLYHKKGWAFDNRLLSGDTMSNNLWVQYKNGYVHKITGEYVKGLSKPQIDSMPCWTINRMVIGYGRENTQLENATAFALALIELMK